MNIDEKTFVVCMSCMTPNDSADVVCRNCRARLSNPSSLDPMQTIKDEGALLRKTVDSRPKFIVLLGTWILFFPWIVLAILLEITILSYWHGLPSLIFFLGGIALLLLPVIIIYKVTRNYLTARGAFENEQNSSQSKDEARREAKARRQARIKNKAVN